MATSGINASTTGMTLDVPALVSQLMTAERQPINKLNTKSAGYQSQISALGLITSKVAAFQTAVQALGSTSSSSLLAFTASSSNAATVSATAGTTAVAGTYSVNVTTLAKAQRLAAAGQTSDTSAISAGASTVTFTVGTTNTDIAIAAGATLQDIRTAINAANIGISATIVNDGSGTPYRLSLSANNEGTSNAVSSITVQAGGDAAINDLLAYNPTTNAPSPAPGVPMAQTVAAANADFTVNGIHIIKSSNTITDAIQGVTLTLGAEAAATLTVARDTASVSTAAATFVQTYNELYSAMKNSTAYKSGSALTGDATLRSMQTQMRDIAATAVGSGNLTNLFQVGISFKADGTMLLDSTKFGSAMTASFSDVASLFNSATGFATRFDQWATTTLSIDGTLANHTTAINQRITAISDQISSLEVRMTALQKQYSAQYTALDVALTRMNQTSAYLTQQFAAMNAQNNA
ncbi:MAG: flagellar filament capping protein FliD [Sideroxyarcus sp.]